MTATQTASVIASLFPQFVNMAVSSVEKDGSTSLYQIARLDTKIGKMKNGAEAEYVVLTKADNEAIVVSLHPNVAAKLFKGGESNGYKLVTEGEPAAEEVIETAEDQAALQAELDAENAAIAGAVAAAEAGQPAEEGTIAEEPKEVKVTAKERAMAIFKEVVGAGPVAKEHRAPVIARFKAELGMGAPGASTYYQNCKKAFAA